MTEPARTAKALIRKSFALALFDVKVTLDLTPAPIRLARFQPLQGEPDEVFLKLAVRFLHAMMQPAPYLRTLRLHAANVMLVDAREVCLALCLFSFAHSFEL